VHSSAEKESGAPAADFSTGLSTGWVLLAPARRRGPSGSGSDAHHLPEDCEGDLGVNLGTMAERNVNPEPLGSGLQVVTTLGEHESGHSESAERANLGSLDSGSVQFHHDERMIERCVVRHECCVPHHLPNLGGDVCERRSVHHHRISDAVNLGGTSVAVRVHQ